MSTRPMPPGEVPQFFARLDGLHRLGLLRDTTTAINNRQASITAMQKIRLGNKFCMLLHVYTPTRLAPEALRRDLAAAVGPNATAQVEYLDEAVKEEYTNKTHAAPGRHLTITCPHKPELVFAVTELLSAQGCKIGKLETKTFVEDDGTLMFSLDAHVSVDQDKRDAIGDQLKMIMQLNKGLNIKLEDTSLRHINLLEHA